MDVEALIVLSLIIVGIVWGFWLIFKRDLMQNQLGKLLSYFLGVVVTLLMVLWLVSRFLPWWAVRLVKNTQESPSVVALQEVGVDLINDLNDTSIVVDEGPTQPGNNTGPGTGISPPATPEVQSQSLPGCGSRQITVVKDDTLYSISRRYGTSVEALKQCNGLNSNLILVGQKLTVP